MFIFGFFANLVSAIAIKIVSHRIDPCFFLAPIVRATTFRELEIDMDNIAIEVGVFTFVIIKVTAFLTFG